MTEKWVSNVKHWCRFCRVFIDGKPRSIKVHENGQIHKDRVTQHLNKLAKERQADEKFNGALTAELQEIERAAIKAGNRDIATGHTRGYRNASLSQPGQAVLGDKTTKYPSTTWADFAVAQFTEHDPNTFDYISHYNKQYGHVAEENKTQVVDEENAEILEQVEEQEAEKDWVCGTCNQTNFPTRKVCRKCKNKRAVVEKVVGEEYPGWLYDEATGEWKKKVDLLEGDEGGGEKENWVCGACKQTNFPTRKVCKKCKKARNTEEKVEGQEYPGWVYDEEDGEWKKKEDVLKEAEEQERARIAEARIQAERDAQLAKIQEEETKKRTEEERRSQIEEAKKKVEEEAERTKLKLEEEKQRLLEKATQAAKELGVGQATVLRVFEREAKAKLKLREQVENELLEAEREAAASGAYNPSAPPGIKRKDKEQKQTEEPTKEKNTELTVEPVVKVEVKVKEEPKETDKAKEIRKIIESNLDLMDPKKRKKELARLMWEEAEQCTTVSAAEGVVELAEKELRAAVLNLSNLSPSVPPQERELCLSGITTLKQRIEKFKQRAETLKKGPKVKQEEGKESAKEETENVDENTGMGGWVVAEKPLYSARETAPEQPKKGKKQRRTGEEEDSDEENSSEEKEEQDDTGIDKKEYLADFGFSAIVKVPKKKKESSDEDEEDAPAVQWKKRKRDGPRRATRGI